MTITSQPLTTVGLPGIHLTGMPATARPDILRLAGTDLFAGVNRPGQSVTLGEHRRTWGRQPLLPLDALVAAAQSADLRGAGGAGFPTHRKLSAMAGNRVSAVVINGSEGEPTSAKDGILLAHVPHLVLDGAVAAAAATGCRKIVIQIADDRPATESAVVRALAERDDAGLSWSLQPVADRFVAGEASAVIQRINGAEAVPRDLGKPPRDPGYRLRRSHVFLSNVETYARLALASRGHRMTTAVVTVSGAVDRPGVYEVPVSWTALDVGRAAGQVEDPRLLITGGWHGTWMVWEDIKHVALQRDLFESTGARWGAGAMVWLPGRVRPQQALAGITTWLAAESAGQCGPCVEGLPALARAVQRESVITHEFDDVDGRGQCAHPTATVAAVRSALNAIHRLNTGGTP